MSGEFQPARQLVLFWIVGLGATVLYAVLAALFSIGETALLRPGTGSVLAYAIAAAFSYTGHKYFTFVSDGAHRFEAPRFVALTLLGLAISFALPAVLSGILGVPAAIPIVLTCLLVPLVNYLVLSRWVFVRGREHA